MAIDHAEAIRTAYKAVVDEKGDDLNNAANLSRAVAVLIAGALSVKTGHLHVVTSRLIPSEDRPPELRTLEGKRVFCVYDLMDFNAGNVWVDETRSVLGDDGKTWTALHHDTDLLNLPRQKTRPAESTKGESDITVVGAYDPYPDKENRGAIAICIRLMEKETAHKYYATDLLRMAAAIEIKMRQLG
jgi:hypothetical protein